MVYRQCLMCGQRQFHQLQRQLKLLVYPLGWDTMIFDIKKASRHRSDTHLLGHRFAG